MTGVFRFSTIPAILATLSFQLAIQAVSPRLELTGFGSNSWPRLTFGEPTYQLYTIQSSANLTNWTTVAVLHGREFVTNPPALSFIDPGATDRTRFYRLRIEPIKFEDDWRNQVFYPDDEFRNESLSFGLPETRWIKFAIQTNEPTRVYYQNSWKYKFHYNFASARLPAFRNLSPTQFDEISLRTNSQQIVLGAVLFSPRSEDREVGIQFVGQDPYAPEQIARWFEIVRSTIQPLGELNVRYIPTYEQAGVAENNRAFFAARGIIIGSLNDWDTGANAYSTGWAIGKLKFVPAAQITQAYSNGTLKPDDILLTDGIPAEIPYVAGILTLAPSTPNSHVAILARSYAIPFAYLAEPELRALAQAYIGRDIVLSAFPGYPQVSIHLLDITNVDPALRQEIADTKRTGPLTITPKAHFGAYTAPTDALVPTDIKYFGGKAANFGFIRRQIPSNSPAAIAISFDLWDDFMNQTNATGKTLRAQISERLSKYTYPPNIAALSAELEAIRDLIEDSTIFTPEQQQQIAAALLARFEPQTRIRFRSSTNVEDSESFTGAGLYDSYSGCLADDQDSDTAGPSICNPAEEKERGVFRAIRKVYASFYNLNAVLERMRHNVDESKVGMAILVHYSTPDEFEMANGVATITYTQTAPNPRTGPATSYEGKLVTQKGAVSVTNPDGTAQPEVVSISKFGGTPYASVQQWSSLVPFGANVLAWDSEYKSFADLFEKTALAFQNYYTNKKRFTLDFEYKKVEPGLLRVKQVREIPSDDPDTTVPTYLLNEPQEWSVFQGEFGTVFANHRLKSKLQLTTRDLKLTTNALQQTIYGPLSMTYVDGASVKTLTGNPATFSNATHRVGQADQLGTPLIDSWTLSSSNGPRQMSLTTKLRTTAAPTQSPILTLSDAQMDLSARYHAPVPILEFSEAGLQPNSVNEESVFLKRTQTTNSRSIEVTRTIPASVGAAITTTFYWPEPPQGPTAGYTAPLLAWKETRIEGLTTEPIILRDYYSQSYRPHHHNFSEDFLFEPALEPGISPAILSELEAKDIRQIYAFWGGDFESRIFVSGRDGSFRPLSTKPGPQ
jgi:hypothetical protein